MTWWWLPPARCPHPNMDFLHVLGLEEANDVNLHLQPLQGLLEEMEQMDYSQVSDVWQNNQEEQQSPRGFGGTHPPSLTRLWSRSCGPSFPRCSALSACSGVTVCTTTRLPT